MNQMAYTQDNVFNGVIKTDQDIESSKLIQRNQQLVGTAEGEGRPKDTGEQLFNFDPNSPSKNANKIDVEKTMSKTDVVDDLCSFEP